MHDHTIVDARGLKCPVNWAKAKVALENLPARATLEVLVDDPRSERELPAAAEAEGHAVLGVVPEAGYTRIVIEK